MRTVTDDERRARLATRHLLAPSSRAGSVREVVRAMTVLHATEPQSVYLSCWARSHRLTVADIDRALYDRREMVKQLAMRRTLFVFPTDLLAAAWSSSSARVAEIERARMTKDVLAAGIGDHDWLDLGRAEVLALLDNVPAGLTASEIRLAVPRIDVKMAVTPHELWSASRVLGHLGLTGELVRGPNTGHWRVSRPRWTLTRHWLSELPKPLTSAESYREIVRRWLFTFGPGTEADLVWWLGSTKTVVRAALADLDAVQVQLDGGDTGWLLPDDLDEVPDPGPWAALLPVLDPTVMGWQGRDFYLGAHRSALFDTRGNAGTTAWVDGRVVGCWVQDETGKVELRLLQSVSARARRNLEVEARRLTDWLGGTQARSLYSSPATKSSREPRSVGI